MNERNPEFPWRDGRPTHLPCTANDVPDGVIVPGDPARVDRFGAILEDFAIIGQEREFRYGVGWHEGTRIGVCSTGIGGPSTEIALVELFNLGARTFLRAGGMGAIDPALPLGGLVAVTRALRNTGAARAYAPIPRDLAPDTTLLADVVTAAERLGVSIHGATIMSTDSYYLGQGRPTGPEGDSDHEWIAQARRRGAQGFDMETETVLAVAEKLGARAAAILTVHTNRAKLRWLENYEGAQDHIVRLAAQSLAARSSREVPPR